MKKIMAVCLAVCILCMSVCVVSASDKGLEQAILSVKTVIDIPEDYSEFNYYNYTNNDMSVWQLTWEGEGGYIDASINGDGVILNYYTYERNNERKSWSDMTEAEAEAMAFDFVKKVNPTLAQVLVLDQKNAYSPRCEFVYAETINGIKLYNRMTYVTVDRVLKKVVSYSTLGKTKKTALSAENVISADTALDKYTESLGAEIIYEKKYDNKEKTITTYPVYKLKDTSPKAISAVSGDVVSYKTYEGDDANRGGGSANGNMKDEAMLESAAPSLSPAELAAIETVSGLMSIEDADKYIKSEFGVSENTSLRTYIEKDYYLEKYRITLNYSGKDNLSGYSARATLDAQTGKLLYFNEYKNKYEKVVQKPEAEIKAAAEAFVAKYAKEDMALCMPFEMTTSEYTDDKRYYFTAQRMANGAKVSGENLSLTLSADGAVIYFSNNITDCLEFESIENAITENEAVKKIAALSDYGLIYVYSDAEDKYIPVYEFENKYININPLTGEKINITEPAPQKPESYSDISGHWAEEIINSLLNNGYFMAGDTFEPDRAITVKEFLSFAKFVSDRTSDDNIILLIAKTEPEKQAVGEDIDVNQILSREIAARYITDSMGYYDIASYSEIFKYPFNDEVAAKENVGYISICYAKNIFKGDGDGNFNPKKEMTRAEAAAVIYNYYSTR